MKKKYAFVLIKALIILVYILLLTFQPLITDASNPRNELETDAGIGFTTSSSTVTSTSSSRDKLPETGGGSNKWRGSLPKTGALTEPFIILILGWALAVLSLTIFTIVRKKYEEQEEM
ncbi:hypothetical protein [Candidatus Enterococcus lemimoniae]|uniref:Gram-positive cocci surface proteins LPxTG domain-containing protein n=1 Tax=Candidatus Enterococcus lemimoniae TaxID=1834167 RepID=A0ABZ2TB53_9ENTE|nr:hypothetical protein [Enterococcus sp. 12C11_DIV0727]OTO70720.1 hypothetical protein A5866_002957 [Enterococcus sp. 12C11_DIV0727]